MAVDSIQGNGYAKLRESIQQQLQQKENEIAQNNIKRVYESIEQLNRRKANRKVDAYIPSAPQSEKGTTLYKP